MTSARSGYASACRTGAFGAALAFIGITLSGPPALALVAVTHPQPPWRDAELFAENYHFIQVVPYLAGLLLVAGFVILIASLHQLAGAQLEPVTACASVFAAVFAALIALNYVVQTSFVPDLARNYRDSAASLVAALSMSNPKSLAWGIEMWGYAFLGVATWLAAPIFRRTPLERAVAFTFVANGVMGLAGAACTVARPGWVMTAPGVAAFAAWNLLAAAMTALAFVALRRRAHNALVENEREQSGTPFARIGMESP
jgi:hypothetical protein